MGDYLTPILARKQKEVARRKRRAAVVVPLTAADAERGRLALDALRRPAGGAPRVIAEIKRRSPSAGEIRKRERGDIASLAGSYQRGGAAAISVLCDGPGFGGSVLDLRRAARASALPLLFKEFVLDEVQLDLARAIGAHMVLLIVRAIPGPRLAALVDATLERGLAPVVEAADARELDAALATRATLVGVNARDLRTFGVDRSAAVSALARIPGDRIAIHMSGIRTAEDLAEVGSGRADAVLIGESLMRASDPARKLRELLRA
ncbi:MAG TPA: indole-3-glycerol phosphate synthase TrpC [Polyangiales bacterium]|nr:indole-3-glycerol phosphate synthase TrpC [Polyangiales bacterium]